MYAYTKQDRNCSSLRSLSLTHSSCHALAGVLYHPCSLSFSLSLSRSSGPIANQTVCDRFPNIKESLSTDELIRYRVGQNENVHRVVLVMLRIYTWMSYPMYNGVHAFSKAHPNLKSSWSNNNKKYVRLYVWTIINSQVSHEEWLFAKDYFDQNFHTHTHTHSYYICTDTRQIVLFYIYSGYVLKHIGGNGVARARSLHVPFRKREKKSPWNVRFTTLSNSLRCLAFALSCSLYRAFHLSLFLLLHWCTQDTGRNCRFYK